MILIDGLLIDASLTESHTREAEVTEFPVESGSDLSDNIRAKPIEVEIEGIVSDTPIGRVALLRDLDGGGAQKPTRDALDHLERIFERRQPVTIQTDLKVYESMACTSLKIPRDKDTGNTLPFTATFRQIKIIVNQRAAVRAAIVATGSSKRGPQPAKLGPVGSITVFTIRRIAPGQSGGFTSGNGTTYQAKPDWFTGDPGLIRSIVLSDGSGDHFRVGPSDIADGTVFNGKYTPFKRPIVMPAPGGKLVVDEAGRLWHSYPIQKPPADPNTPVAPDTGGETNAQYVQRVLGQTIPGL